MGKTNSKTLFYDHFERFGEDYFKQSVYPNHYSKFNFMICDRDPKRETAK